MATVITELPEPAMDVAVNDEVAPLGSPATARLTIPENPPVLVTLTVKGMLAPAPTVWLDGVALRANEGGTLTVSDVAVAWTRAPLTAVMVRG